jgi:hypothetical protein
MSRETACSAAYIPMAEAKGLSPRFGKVASGWVCVSAIQSEAFFLSWRGIF